MYTPYNICSIRYNTNEAKQNYEKYFYTMRASGNQMLRWNMISRQCPINWRDQL
jgi:hypothetical protein